jgi:hypothetical protein
MKIGADPEVFLLDAQEGFVSAIDRIGGSKRNPLPLPLGDGFAVQEDNVAVEYNIPPAGSKEQLINHIDRVMSHLSDTIAKIGMHFSHESAAVFPLDQLIDIRAMEFGCDPDFNAWKDGQTNPRPKCPDPMLRSCGGHVHIGHEFASKADKIEAVKFIDLFLGVPSQQMDNGQLRKQLYGKAGAFRDKVYGLEYRVLSNYWIFHPKLVGWVWDATSQAMDAWQNNKIDVNAERDTILAAINDNNHIAAQHLIAKYQLPLAHV